MRYSIIIDCKKFKTDISKELRKVLNYESEYTIYTQNVFKDLGLQVNEDFVFQFDYTCSDKEMLCFNTNSPITLLKQLSIYLKNYNLSLEDCEILINDYVNFDVFAFEKNFKEEFFLYIPNKFCNPLKNVEDFGYDYWNTRVFDTKNLLFEHLNKISNALKVENEEDLKKFLQNNKYWHVGAVKKFNFDTDFDKNLNWIGEYNEV